jgi:hypothetical protein
VASTNPDIAKILTVITKIHGGLKVCTKKIVSASKFIDYFVHDMLDYSILNKEEKNFTKTVNSFDIRDAIEEIVEIQEDKIEMKSIQIEKHFEGLKNMNYMVNSDFKRIQ